MSHAAPTTEKKHGFSKLFGGSKKHESSSQPLTQPDLGYTTRDNPTNNPNNSDNVKTTQEVAPNPRNITREDIEQDDDLQVQPKQNEDGSHNVMDRKTGVVVTTVTTTTTTTTTTTSGPGGQQQQKKEVVTERTEPSSLQQPANMKDDAPPNMTRDSGLGSELQNNSNRSSNVSSESGFPSQPLMSSGIYAPTSATGFTNRNEPTMNTREYQPPPGPPPITKDSPPIPERSLARDQNQNMISPPNSPIGANNKHNFSYPSRTAPTPNTAYGERESPIGSGPHAGAMELPAGGEMTPGLDRQQQLGTPDTSTMPASNNSEQPVQRQSTLSNLKAAAAGIHGVGETLRGTLNSNIDRRFPGSGDKEKQAAIVRRHDEVAAAGRSEIENQRFHDSVRERERASAVGKTISRKPLNQQGEGGLGVTNQDLPEESSEQRSKSKGRKFF